MPPSILPPAAAAAPWRSLSSSITSSTARTTTTSSSSTTTTTTKSLPLLLLPLRPLPLLRRRGFATTPARRAVEIPPESPRYIPLPELRQSAETKRPVVKGHLPVPREIFTRRARMAHKLQPGFVDDTAPRSAAERAGLPPKSDKDAWRRRMAESRRSALGAGLSSLWRRKHTREARQRARADAKLARHREARARPERPDELHTRGTVTLATLDTSVVRDPEYEAKQLAKQERTAARAKAKSEARKDAVQRLYVEAGRFILTEQELAAKIEDVFSPEYLPNLARSRSANWWGAANIWEALGRPLRMGEMFSSTTNYGQRSEHWGKSAQRKTDERQRILAGELTGGALAVVSAKPNTATAAATKEGAKEE